MSMLNQVGEARIDLTWLESNGKADFLRRGLWLLISIMQAHPDYNPEGVLWRIGWGPIQFGVKYKHFAQFATHLVGPKP